MTLIVIGLLDAVLFISTVLELKKASKGSLLAVSSEVK